MTPGLVCDARVTVVLPEVVPVLGLVCDARLVTVAVVLRVAVVLGFLLLVLPLETVPFPYEEPRAESRWPDCPVLLQPGSRWLERPDPPPEVLLPPPAPGRAIAGIPKPSMLITTAAKMMRFFMTFLPEKFPKFVFHPSSLYGESESTSETGQKKSGMVKRSSDGRLLQESGFRKKKGVRKCCGHLLT
jgi:hypothetical protein